MIARNWKRLILTIAVLVSMVAAISVGCAPPEGGEGELPKVVGITCYKPGQGGYIFASGIKQCVDGYTPMHMYLEPRNTDMERFLPVKNDEVEFVCWGGPTMADCVLGWGGFAEIGPQPISMTWFNPAVGMVGVYVKGDSDIYKPEDLKGKRVPYAPASTSAFTQIGFWLAYGGLTYDDVIKIPCPSLSAIQDSLLADETDCAWGEVRSATTKKTAAAPGGIRWIEVPAKTDEDKAKWERGLAEWPYTWPTHATMGAVPEGGVDISGAANPICAMMDQSEDVVYEQVKATHLGYEEFLEPSPYMLTWTLDEALNTDKWKGFPVAYHPGAIKYFKEIGRWTPELEEIQKTALERGQTELKKWQDGYRKIHE